VAFTWSDLLSPGFLLPPPLPPPPPIVTTRLLPSSPSRSSCWKNPLPPPPPRRSPPRRPPPPPALHAPSERAEVSYWQLEPGVCIHGSTTTHSTPPSSWRPQAQTAVAVQPLPAGGTGQADILAAHHACSCGLGAWSRPPAVQDTRATWCTAWKPLGCHGCDETATQVRWCIARQVSSCLSSYNPAV
jgi:hypothetical protein